MTHMRDTMRRVHAALTGTLVCRVWEDDRLVREIVGSNLVLLNMETVMLQALAGAANKAITQIGVGTNASAPALSDAALTAAVIVAVTTVMQPNPTTIAVTWRVNAGVATGLSISEFGLFTADNTLVARKALGAPILKGATVRLDGTWTLTQ